MPQTTFYAPVATDGHAYTLVKTIDHLVYMPPSTLLKVVEASYFTVAITCYFPESDSAIVTCAYEQRTAEEAEQLKKLALNEGWRIW